MNGEQKAWVLTAWALVAFFGWLAWNVNDYYSHALSARPSAEIILGCMHECTDSCAAAVEEDRE